MTIEEAIEFKKHGYHTPLSSFKNIDDMNTQISKCYEYDRLALETMQKYQKIQEIVEHWACCGNPSDSMIAISEVLEDGQNIIKD